MKKTFIILTMMLALFTNYCINAQDTCESPKEETSEDLNTITKCAVVVKSSKKNQNKRSRLISVRISAPRKRFLKKRFMSKRKTLNNSNSLNTSGLENIKSDNNSELETLELRKSVANLTNNLSVEEVRKASKFIEVDDIPTFNNCKKITQNEAMKCFNKEMINHIQEHFNYPAEAIVKKAEGEVWVRFIIDKNGEVTNIKTLGPKNGELLKLEAKRVASKLPKFLPAVKNGNPVAVKYGFPINFSLNQ